MAKRKPRQKPTSGNGATMKKLHPLMPWLKKANMTRPVFATKHGLKFRTLYDHTQGDVAEPKLSTMQAIEDATGGVVTVAKQAAWFKRQAK